MRGKMVAVRIAGRPWWQRGTVPQWYRLGVSFLLVGAAQIMFTVVRGAGYAGVVVGAGWLLIGVLWFAAGLHRRRHERSGGTQD
jgi:hypothetical protein